MKRRIVPALALCAALGLGATALAASATDDSSSSAQSSTSTTTSTADDTAGSDSSSTSTTPKPIPLDIHKLSAAVTVDGKIGSAWSGFGQSVPVRADQTPPDASNLSATAYLGWTDSDLYIAFNVTDDKAVWGKTASDLAQNDAVEFWLGPDLWFTAGVLQGGKPGIYVTNLKDWSKVDLSKVQIAATSKTGGYTVELAIPAALVKQYAGADLAAGGTFKFAFGVDDADVPSPVSVYSLYFPSIYGWNNSLSYADAKLVD